MEFSGEELGFWGLHGPLWFKGQQVVTVSHLWGGSLVGGALQFSWMEL